MSHWSKVVAGACKPKHAPPKAKYIDALVSATYQADGSLQDVTRALSQRFRDPSDTVVFKCLLVVHTLIRAGNAAEVLPYWSGSDGRDGRGLGLTYVETLDGGRGQDQIMGKYAHYLNARLKCFAALKHDPIRTRAEATARLGKVNAGGGANRLRTLTVDKGLLREVGTLQKLLDSLVDCKFYLTDTDDDIVMTSLRLLVKDLLVLFQAVNEGVINVLEHYFEMSKVDATSALKSYKIFCRQCEKVVAYLGVAKKMSNIINVNIPNLRHAPVSLAGSLQEYLDDPNFEKNRQEYKENKAVADGKAPAKEASSSAKPEAKASTSTTPAAPPADPSKSLAFTDFFASIESEQQSMFNPTTDSPSTAYFQQNQGYNPFLAQQQTGFVGNGMGGGVVEGMSMAPQQTGWGAFNPTGQSTGQALFGMQQQAPQQQPPQMMAQPTGFAMGGQMGMMAPQQTGVNPFRQSMMQPSMTGNAFQPQQQQMQPQMTGYNPFLQQQQQQQQPVPPMPTGFPNSPFGVPDRANGATSAPPVQSNNPFPFSAAPFNNQASAAAPAPLVPQVTGSRNPFAPPPGSAPPVPAMPAAPSLNTLAASAFSHSMVQQRAQQEAARLQAEQAHQNGGMETLSNGPGGAKENGKDAKNGFSDFFASQLERLEGGGKTVNVHKTGGGGLFSDVASEFAVTRPKSAGDNPFPSSGAMGSFSAMGGMNANPTGSTPFSSAFGGSTTNPSVPDFTGGNPAPLAPQTTGFGGSSIRPFQPASSFGASLASALPPLPAASPAAPSAMGPQPTGAPNPFRMSAMPTGASAATGSSSFLSSQPTGFSGFSSALGGGGSVASTTTAFSGLKPFQPSSTFGQTTFSAPTGQPAQPATASLI